MVHTRTAATPAGTQHAAGGPLRSGPGPALDRAFLQQIRWPPWYKAHRCVDLEWICADRCTSSHSARAGRRRTPLCRSARSEKGPGTGSLTALWWRQVELPACSLTHSHLQAHSGAPRIPPCGQGGRAIVMPHGLKTAVNVMVCTQSMGSSQTGEPPIAWTARDSRQHSCMRADLRTSTRSVQR